MKSRLIIFHGRSTYHKTRKSLLIPVQNTGDYGKLIIRNTSVNIKWIPWENDKDHCIYIYIYNRIYICIYIYIFDIYIRFSLIMIKAWTIVAQFEDWRSVRWFYWIIGFKRWDLRRWWDARITGLSSPTLLRISVSHLINAVL